MFGQMILNSFFGPKLLMSVYLNNVDATRAPFGTSWSHKSTIYNRPREHIPIDSSFQLPQIYKFSLKLLKNVDNCWSSKNFTWTFLNYS